MRANNRHSSFATLLLLGIALPGFIGILVVQAKVNSNQPDTADIQFAGGEYIHVDSSGYPHESSALLL